MTEREISRANVFSEISQKKISQIKAAEILGISARHVRRLYAKYVDKGLSALVSKKRGKPSNHQMAVGPKAHAKELLSIELYKDFGPTFMCETLKEQHEIEISVETTRKLMIQEGLWEANKKRCPVIHQQRKRRARCGELIQIDGSPHAWFEDRGDPCCLIVFIDDATGQSFGFFFETETLEAYLITTKAYIIKYGRPLAFYSDKHAIFRINRQGCLKKELITQFGRVCRELDIQLICAHSPQAKGRVERCNQTQQDRLVKELRLAGISTIEDANKFLPMYWEKHNKKFAVAAASEEKAHRILTREHDLDRILCRKSQRVITKNLELQHNNIIYQILIKNPSWSLRGAKVTIIETLDGQVHIEYKGKDLPFNVFSEQEFMGAEVDSKEIDRFLKKKHQYGVSPHNHPWLQKSRCFPKNHKMNSL